MWASVIFTRKFKNEWPTVTAPPVVGGRYRREMSKRQFAVQQSAAVAKTG